MTRSPDGFLIVARASRGGSYNLPQSGGGGLETREIYPLTILETRSQKSRCRQQGRLGVQREEAPHASLPASRGARQPWVRLGYGGSITPNSASPHAACLPPSFPFFYQLFLLTCSNGKQTDNSWRSWGVRDI